MFWSDDQCHRAAPVVNGDGQTLEASGVSGRLIDPNVTRLAKGTALIRQVQGERWPLAAAAMLAGAPPEQVADACGLTLGELRAAVSRWATVRLRHGEMTEAQHVELINITFGPAS